MSTLTCASATPATSTPEHDDAAHLADVPPRAVPVTEPTIGPDTDIYLADTLNEMGLFLRLADVVVMGGSFAPAIGLPPGQYESKEVSAHAQGLAV